MNRFDEYFEAVSLLLENKLFLRLAFVAALPIFLRDGCVRTSELGKNRAK